MIDFGWDLLLLYFYFRTEEASGMEGEYLQEQEVQLSSTKALKTTMTWMTDIILLK